MQGQALTLTHQRLLSVLIILKDPVLEFSTSGIRAYRIFNKDKDEEIKDAKVDGFEKDAYVSSFLDIPSNTKLHRSIQQTTTPIPKPIITIDALTVTVVVPESNALTAIELRVVKLEKDVSELKAIDHSSVALVVLQSYVPTVVDSYLDTKVKDVFQKELKKHTTDLIHKYSLQHLPELTKKSTPTTEQEYEKSLLEILKIKKEQAESQKNPQFTIKSTDKASLEEYDLKSALYQSMHANMFFNRTANHRLYQALMEALIEDENTIDKRGKKTKRRRTKESESLKKPSTTKETPKGKAPTKGFKTGKSASEKEPVEEPIAEMIMDDAGDDLTSDPDVTYTTFITKTKVARYKIKGIEDMVPTLWITIKHAYEKDASIGIKHKGERRKLWYRSQTCFFCCSTQVIPPGWSDIVDFIVALCMFTRSLILKRRVEDLQLSVESYQKKLNFTKPHKTFLEIEFKEPYTPSYDPPGIAYEDLDKQKRVFKLMSCISSQMAHSSLFMIRFITEYSTLTFVWITTRRYQRGSGRLLIEKY
nr:hypothetical protein [Tanacetum cinerariifolium]